MLLGTQSSVSAKRSIWKRLESALSHPRQGASRLSTNSAAMDRATTTHRSRQSTAPRLALSPDEAAVALGVSRDFFDQHIAHELRVVRRGRRRLVAVAELERWLTT